MLHSISKNYFILKFMNTCGVNRQENTVDLFSTAGKLLSQHNTKT